MDKSASNLDTLRRDNLSLLLEYIHYSGPMSRSELTESVGLTRSTVAVLVAELVELGLLVEGSPVATNRVGRPSPLVDVNPNPVAIAIHPNLDSVVIGVVGLGARVDCRVRHEVDHAVSPAEAIDIMGTLIDEVRPFTEGRTVVGLGMAIPGMVRSSDGLVRSAPLLGWVDTPIGALAEEAFGFPVAVGNDVRLAALAERRFGAAKGVHDLLYWSGSPSGVRGSVITGGRPLEGRSGYAGEFGYGRPALFADSDRATAEGKLGDEVSRQRLLDATGQSNPDELELAAALLNSPSDAVLQELSRQRRVLASSLSNAVNVFNPEVIVLGGFLAAIYDSGPDELDALIAAHALEIPYEDVSVTTAALGQDPAVIGAADLALARLLSDPASMPR